jgi:hypothetical protein
MLAALQHKTRSQAHSKSELQSIGKSMRRVVSYCDFIKKEREK